MGIPRSPAEADLPGEAPPPEYLRGYRDAVNDLTGRLLTCEHSGRRVTRTELDGSITVIADAYQGKKLNAPNDVAVASNGTIWFTDPGYGIKGDYEGLREPFEQEKHNVFRVDPRSGDIKVVADDFVMPNGITFSPDEKKLYVVASRAEPHRQILSYDVTADGKMEATVTIAINQVVASAAYVAVP